MGTQLPPEKRHTHPLPIFGPCLLWPNGWMDEDASWYGSRPRHRPHCIRLGPSCPRKGNRSPHIFDHVYCGHGRPSQLVLSSCFDISHRLSLSSLQHSRTTVRVCGVCVSVCPCLSVCPFTRISQKPYVHTSQNCLYMFPVAVAWSCLTTMQFVIYFRFCG